MPIPQPSIPLSQLLDLSADMLHAVQAGRSLSDTLLHVDTRHRPGVQALTFTALRQLGAAQELLRGLAPKPPPAKVQSLLCVALALLWPADRPAYAAHTLVDQAVAAARRRTPAAAAFVNAVLRRYLREQAPRVEQALLSPTAQWNHPPWWIERLRRDWPQSWQTLRINRRRGSGADYVARLAAQGRDALLLTDRAFGAQAVVLSQPCPVGELPGFNEGDVSVQDASAQRAALLLWQAGALPSGARVLDACAAPGGKTAHLLELAELDLLALDHDAQRLERALGTLQRLHLKAELKCADASRPATWWDGRPFDAILLDAPCSASGIVRRHPDIRWLRRESDISNLVALQARMLDALWPLLKPGGQLLYVTCSLFKCEGQTQIDAFLQRHGAAGAALQGGSPGHLLTVPDNCGEAGTPATVHDGFYYALIRKDPPLP